MSGFDMTTAAATAVLKQLYSSDEISFKMFEQDPFLREIKKNTSFGGAGIKSLQVVSPLQGASGDYASTQLGNNVYAGWNITTLSHMFHKAYLDTEVMLRANNDKNAFIDALKSMQDGAIETLRDRAETEIWGNGGRALAQLAATSTVNTAVATLADRNQCVNLRVGMKIEFSSADGTSGAVTTAGGVNNYAYISAIDFTTGSVTITSDAALTTTVAWNAAFNGASGSYYIFAYGDFKAANSGISGALAWIPVSTPSSAAFHAVDRSVDPTRLAGHRIDASSMTIQEGLISAIARCKMEGAVGINRCYLNTDFFGQLVIETSGKLLRDPSDTKQNIGFQSMSIVGANGPVQVYCSNKVPTNKAFLTRIEDWELLSAGNFPQVLDMDGLMIRKDTSTAGWVEEWAWYANLKNKAPVNSGIVSFV